MVFRGRREERREERHEGRREERRAVHYRMRQKLVSIGDDYWIEDGDGRRAYKVDGKALRVRKTLNFEDPHGQHAAADPGAHDAGPGHDGDRGPGRPTVATVKQGDDHPAARPHDGRDRGRAGPATSRATSSTTSTRSRRTGATVAEVSKRWFRVRGHLRRRDRSRARTTSSCSP